jgi:hypothetical protein
MKSLAWLAQMDSKEKKYAFYLPLLLVFIVIIFSTSRSKSSSDQKTIADIEVLILDAIKTAMRFQKSSAEAWLKVCFVY